MKPTALVFLGAGFGGVSRYWFGFWVTKLLGNSFPWGTLSINIIGSLLIGLFFGIQPPTDDITDARYFIVIGLLGGYTTFSAFSFETLHLIQKHEYLPAAGYALGSVIAGIIAAALGHWIGTSIAR